MPTAAAINIIHQALPENDAQHVFPAPMSKTTAMAISTATNTLARGVEHRWHLVRLPLRFRADLAAKL